MPTYLQFLYGPIIISYPISGNRDLTYGSGNAVRYRVSRSPYRAAIYKWQLMVRILLDFLNFRTSGVPAPSQIQQHLHQSKLIAQSHLQHGYLAR